MRKLLSVILSLLVSTAHADTITFRSGDHAEFARIVADIPVGTVWEVGLIGERYVLQVDPDLRFETSAIFDRIQRDRLGGVEAEPGTGRLFLDTVCDCHLDAFLFAPDKLVIDIKDGPPLPGSPFERSLTSTGQSQTVSLPLFAGIEEGQPADEFAETLNTFGLTSTTDPIASAFERTLIESLGRAATQGVLEIAGSQTDDLAFDPPPPAAATSSFSEPVPTPPAIELRPPVMDAPEPVTLEAATTEGRLRIQSVFDRDRPEEGPITMTRSGSPCLDDSHFDFTAWSQSEDFSREIAEHRRQLFGEEDELSGAALEHLARTYLFFGFGTEAISTLGLDGARSVEREIIAALGTILDENNIARPAFSDQAGCAQSVALWRALERKSVEGIDEAEKTAVISTLRVLPGPLRPGLSERVAALFLAEGDPIAAEIILLGNDSDGSVQTNPGQPEASLYPEDPTTDLGSLREGILSDPRVEPATVAAVIDRHIQEGSAVDDDLLAMADAIRFERRGTPDEELLGEAVFRALIAQNSFAAARRTLDELEMLSDHARQSNLDTLVRSIAERSSDGEFLDFFFGGMIDQLGPDAENAVAGRLLDLGFAEQASELLDGPASGVAMSDRRLLRAQAALALDQSEVAASILTGMADPRSLAVLELAADQAAIPEDPWRSGDWQRLRRQDDPLLRDVASAMLSEPEVSDQETSLAERSSLIAEAESTRQLMIDLLERFEIEPMTPADNPGLTAVVN
jgi:hypothetical protein